ncbi:MAG TPA: Hsp20/alpha crystallin family protein [Ktedonobacteraceae bacterium]|nr:Hsp20/alpha crystallin family protein [Ktedonobacteraceae bacterium]
MPEKAKIQQVPLKVYQAEDRLTVAAPMAGMEPEDLAIEITDDGRLLLDGKVRGLLKDVKVLLLDEWSVGAYYRDYLLPEPVDGSQATATYGNGVLVVTFPLANRFVPARLTLSSNGVAHGISDNVALP